MVYYALQLRELRRFLETKESALKSESLSNILDSHSDSIIVVEEQEDSVESPDATINDSEAAQLKTPNIIYCNRKCVELFGLNLSHE